jgi:hypothetical protein
VGSRVACVVISRARAQAFAGDAERTALGAAIAIRL